MWLDIVAGTPRPVAAMKQDDYVPRVNGVLGLTYQESVDYFGIGNENVKISMLDPYVEYDGDTPPEVVEVEGGRMKRSPYHE